MPDLRYTSRFIAPDALRPRPHRARRAECGRTRLHRRVPMNLINRWFQPPTLHSPAHGVEKKASWLELFYDLIYVAAFIQLGNHLSRDMSASGVLGFAGLFLPLWLTWTSFTFYANRFDTDDAFHRGLVFLQMFGLGAMAVSIDDVFAGDTTRFASAYLLVRILLVFMYARVWHAGGPATDMAKRYTLGFIVGAAFWASAVAMSVVNDGVWVFGIWAVALVVDFAVPLTPGARVLALRHPPDVLHMSERYGILTIIVLGESFVKMLGEISARFAEERHAIEMMAGEELPDWAAVSSTHLILMAGLALVLTCSLWWLYFDDVAGSRIRARPLAPFIWVYTHLPFHMAVVASGVAIKKAVFFPVDVPANTKYAALLCGSLALAFFMVAILDSVTHRRVTEVKEHVRVAFRVGSGTLLLLLIPVSGLMPGAVFLGMLAALCVVQVLADLFMAPQAAIGGHDHEAQHSFELLRPVERGTGGAAADDEDDNGQQVPPKRWDVGTAVRKGTPDELRRDLYFQLMEATWTQLFVGVTVAYVGTNVVFAALYMLDPSGVAEMDPRSFFDAFSFSVQTMASIGYGVMNPVSTWANTLVAVEAAVSMAGIALITGLMFAKASRPQSSVLFSNKMVVSLKHGVPTLMMRVGNARGNDLVEANLSITALVEDVSPEGHKMRKLVDLPLERSRTPVFTLTWTVFHPITEGSPLHGVTPENAPQRIFGVIVTLTGHDSTYAQTTHARKTYYPEDIHFGSRFVDVISNLPDGRLMVDYDKFHDVERDA